MIGQLKLAMANHWDEVDKILDERKVSHKEAFRRKHKSMYKSRNWYSHRSYIALEALRELIDSHLLSRNVELKNTLIKLMDDLLCEINDVIKRKQNVYDALEICVNNIHTINIHGLPKERKEKDDAHVGTEICDSACGRKYHFTIRCCELNHNLILADKTVGYIVRGNQIFLDKCNAFSALGRMYVIRCSDYRKSDKLLDSSGLIPKKHFLFERRNYSTANPRNRRTHVSLEAFITLVNVGFADSVKNESLLSSIEKIIDDTESLKKNCPNYKEEEEEEDANSSQHESGIESGASSESGKASPVNDQPSTSKQPNNVNKIQILNKEFNYRLEHSKLYLDVKGVNVNLLKDSNHTVTQLKKKARDFNLQFAFYPSYFKKGFEQYISVECLLKLIHAKSISLQEGINLRELINELRKLKNSCKLNDGAVVVSDNEDNDEEIIEVEDEELKEDSESEDDEGIQLLPFEIVDSGNKSTIRLLENQDEIGFQVVNDIFYLDKKPVFKLFKLNYTVNYYRTYRSIDKLLESQNVCLDDAFLYDGRIRSFISLDAFKILVNHDYLSDSNLIQPLNARIAELETQKESLKTNRILTLRNGRIQFKSTENTVYLNTIQLLRVVGFNSVYLDNNPSKAYFTVTKLLSQRGLNVASCFLKQGKSKYVYVSLYAVIVLFQTEFGPFKDKDALKTDILNSLRDLGLIKDNHHSNKSIVINHETSFKYLKLISENNYTFRYKIRGNNLYLHRKSVFEATGLERAIMSGSRGYEPINSILLSSELDFESIYLKSKREKYAYISLAAILYVLDSKDPIIVCLENKEKFYVALLSTIQYYIGDSLKNDKINFNLEGTKINYKFWNHRLYLLRHTCYSLSGLYDKATFINNGEYDIYEDPLEPLLHRGMKGPECFLSEGGDEFAYISVDALLVLMNLDGGADNRTSLSSNTSSTLKLNWNDVISAISYEVPKLKIFVKMVSFKNALLNTILDSFIQYKKNKNGEIVENDENKIEIVDLVTETTDDDEIIAVSPLFKDGKKLNRKRKISPDFNSIKKMRNNDEYECIKNSVLDSNRDGMIGDWTVMDCDQDNIRLVINPGYGTSKKMSFIHPDVTAILRYELRIDNVNNFYFIINDRRVPPAAISATINKSLKKGFLNLLYNLQTLRPCFGSFNPELVETVGGNQIRSDIFIDRSFIGSSQNGRTYAGTVRNVECSVLSQSGVSDTCEFCASLDEMVINRSTILTTEESNQDKTYQKSVWTIESTDKVCTTFVCPQIQSFNTSRRNQFIGSQQASTIVKHVVDIKADLNTVIKLNGREINKSFPDFVKDKQVSVLLDQVASLRHCVGFPETKLVEQTRFILGKKHLLPNDVKKYFNGLTVDETFVGKMSNKEGVDLKGTLRINTCKFYIANDLSDNICDQCRLLQEPLEFLGI